MLLVQETELAPDKTFALTPFSKKVFERSFGCHSSLVVSPAFLLMLRQHPCHLFWCVTVRSFPVSCAQIRTMGALAVTPMNAVASVPVVRVGPEEAPRNAQPRQRHCPATSAGASAQLAGATQDVDRDRAWWNGVPLKMYLLLSLVVPGAVGPEEDKSLASASRIGVVRGFMPKTPAPSNLTPARRPRQDSLGAKCHRESYLSTACSSNLWIQQTLDPVPRGLAMGRSVPELPKPGPLPALRRPSGLAEHNVSNPRQPNVHRRVQSLPEAMREELSSASNVCGDKLRNQFTVGFVLSFGKYFKPKL